ncbi:3'-5' exonuclease [Anaeromassilibacillus sp. An200]|uniref:3'-5' exonuclease n=1 Tax=Anaeromassilibacillus sp. An200 TaxID=1965587 RepID=UPI0013A65E02|nr:3'-5' exonuclease [Anaeromassilibacillus sp. An200]
MQQLKHRSDYTEDLRTERQWRKAGKLVRDGAAGMLLWPNRLHQRAFTYYRTDEVRDATPEELYAAGAPERKRRKRARIRREEQRKKEEEMWKVKQRKIKIWQAQKQEKEKKQQEVNALIQGALELKASVNNPTGIVCIDIETTGLTEIDEIVEISIIDGKGSILVHSLVHPYWMNSWEDVEAIHGISPEQVKDAPYLHELIPRIYAALSSASTCIGYNLYSALSFLPASLSENLSFDTIDVMQEFAPIYGEWSDYYEDYKWQSLSTCAAYYGCTFLEYDSLEDARVTLFCYRQMQNRS